MTLTELEQVKQDVANGVIVNKSTWLKVLDEAIEEKKNLHGIWSLIGQAREADFYDKEGNDIDVDFDRVKILLP